ncbi:hypothetical protein PUR61_05265 [Streptomyces sp. BE20]|uniref:hypothetical protein n=1 Tax=Streptomyces sp. BE20 TaxID=3002525 RepID=UPI002E7782AC|nr:hypothetical protein [Streptomyces sp. BE20]MEE1821607.1 hypothetical protein [Streptomyces sp. BE20]
MINIKYLRTGPYVDRGREHQAEVNLAQVSRSDLRWYYFMSDLSFTVDGVELAPPWSWTPVFDYLWSMHGALHYLERGEASTIGSNENAELIKFTPEAGKIRISSTYSTVTAICELTDLRDAWVAFRDAVLTDLGREHPQLAANPVLAELRL